MNDKEWFTKETSPAEALLQGAYVYYMIGNMFGINFKKRLKK